MMKEPDSNLTASLRHTHRWRMAVSGLVILAAGITLGAAGTLVFVKPVSQGPPRDLNAAVGGMMMRFRGELNLTDEQVEQIRTILRDRMGKLEELRLAARPKIEEQLEAMKSEINAVLTEQQRDDWQKVTERLEREFRRGMRRGRPGGPGGPGGPRGPGDGFRDGRGRFRGPGFGPDDGQGPEGEHGPRDWRRGRPRPGEGAEPSRERLDANGVPLGPEPMEELSEPNLRPEPNAP